jgi:predicted DNA-binding transcriptional regulator AlpA
VDSRTDKPAELEPHYRFADLKQLGIVRDWATLYDWIETRGFPPGILISRRMRLWPASHVQAFLDARSKGARS